MLIVIYFVCALLVAFVGRRNGPGFLATLLMGILLTPIVALLIVLLVQHNVERRRLGGAMSLATLGTPVCPHCPAASKPAASHCLVCGRSL